MFRFVPKLPMWLAGAIAAVLALGWALYAFDANESQWLVGTVMDVARFFADPFRFIFQLDDNVAQIAVNWGIGALVYLLIGAVLSALLGRLLVLWSGRAERSESVRSHQPAR